MLKYFLNVLQLNYKKYFLINTVKLIQLCLCTHNYTENQRTSIIVYIQRLYPFKSKAHSRDKHR